MDTALIELPHTVVDDFSNDLIRNLFAHEDKRIEDEIQRMIRRNSEAYGERRIGFFYEIEAFFEKDAEPGLAVPMLHFSLHDAMDDLLEDRKELELEKAILRQIFTSLIERSTTFQDLRDALPECVHGILPGTKDLDRYNSEGFVLEPGSREYRQFQKYLPRIEFYSSTRLFY